MRAWNRRLRRKKQRQPPTSHGGAGCLNRRGPTGSVGTQGSGLVVMMRVRVTVGGQRTTTDCARLLDVCSPPPPLVHAREGHGVSSALHDTVLKRYRVAAGSARPLRDYHLMHDSSFIHDYRLPRDPSYSTILPSFTTTSALAIPLWKSLPESRASPTIPPWKSLPESPPAPTHRVPSRPNFMPVAAPPTRHTRSRGGLIRTAIRFRADW